MSQDMDAESIMEIPSDIDELEKEKAIESIVLNSSAEDCYRHDFDESDIVIGTDTSANVTDSLYDENESQKSMDTENGNETTETNKKDGDPLDDEHSTNTVNRSPDIQPDSSLPLSMTPLQQKPSCEIQAVTNQVITTVSVASAVQTSPPSKVVYVKFIPKILPQSIVATVTTKSPPKAISLTTLKAKYEKPLEKMEVKKVSPIKIPFEEPTTSNIGSSRPHIGHTVNLLNNNRILIKSVKNNHTNSAPMAIAATTKTETLSISPQPHKDIVSVVQQPNDSSEIMHQIAANVTPTEQINHVKDGKDIKCMVDTNNGNAGQIELEIKKEQLLNENSSEHTVDDNKLSDAIDDDDKNLLSAQKIKREFEQLQKTVNESKVLSEFVIEHNKRSRRPTKSGKSKHKYNSSLINLNAPIDDKMLVQVNRSASPSSSSVRSASKESDRSVTSSFNSGSGGGGGGGKRNTRSMNTDFSAKQKKFLKGIQQVTRGTDDETDNNSGIDDDDDDLDYFAKQQPNINERRKSTVAIKQGYIDTTTSFETKSGWDKYCWRCHQTDTNFICSCCIRSYHANCLKMKLLSPAEMAKWQCPECVDIKAAEKENKKKKFDVKHFNKLLKYAMNRILQDPNLQQFQFPVNKTQNPGYSDVIVNPINLSKIEDNIDNLLYTNSEAFLSDIKWILHNCSIYFSDNYKVTRAAKSLQKVSKQEVGDIETCPECYLNANTMTDNWFTEVCARPHLILWAKLKGFPYWPAKAMSINSTLVDVRFFGEHDRANIPAKDCYLYSREDPNPPTNKYKRNTIADCVKEVDIYVENITAKYGKFNYAELKTPFNPQLAEQHLMAMIPGLRVARGRRRSSTTRPDLTLKIVKTADNHLSVVKKDQVAKELPQIKRTVDITGEGAVSRTPTPPSAVLARRKTSDTRIKRSKSTNRHSDGKLTTLDHKSLQVLRRKSMAVEKLNQKRVTAIHSNIDLNSSNESAEVSFIRYNSKSSNEKNETDSVAIPVAKKTNKATAKKRKMSIDQMKSMDSTETPEKNQKLDDVRATTSMPEEQPIDNFDGNILSSVGLVKRTSPPSKTSEKRKSNSNSTSPKVARNKNSTCDTDEKGEGAARTRTDQMQQDRSKDDSPLILVPFVEVKKELDNDVDSSVRTDEMPSASQTPISLISSTENTPAKNNNDDNVSTIKTETSSDDDSLMIIDDELSNNSSTPAKPLATVDQLLDNIRMRGSISVKDINKMTLQNQQQHARKSFPKGPSNSTFSILKPRNNTALNKSNPPMSQTNMVCIPLDGLPRIDLNYNSSQPPPLSVVGSANSVSLLAQNQPLQSSQSVASSTSNTSSTSTSTLVNGPPPLSIASIPTVVNVSQPSLLSSNSINTISNGMITEQLASAVTDQLIRRNPPQLISRPAAPLRSDSDSVFPTEAGSACKTLIENSHKMTDFFRSVIEDTLSDLANMNNPEAKIRLLEIELEKVKNVHAKEIIDIKANTDRLLAEMKKSMEKERQRIVNDTRKQCEMERIRSVEEAKKKQWCANCLKEAQFYCCWNTSYCNHICQRKHWEQHMATCAQVETAPNVQNLRKTNPRSATKLDVRQQTQATHQTKSQTSCQKDNLNVVSSTVGLRTGAKIQNIAVPTLRNILPKNAGASVINQPTPQIVRHSNQPHSKQNANQQSCIIVGRPLPNWNTSTKSTSLLHPNAIFLPTSSQSYATITSVQSGSPASVSLLNASHAQGQKSNTTETIIIP